MDVPPWVENALQIAIIVVAAVVAIWFLRLAINRAVRELLERRAEAEGAEGGDLTSVDLDRRIGTLQRLAVRITTLVIGIIAILMILDQFGISVGPAIAGLGVVGLAVGFGAQTLIRDLLAGVFIIVENQYSAGDVVKVAGVTGVVEGFSLRRTTLRDLDGTLHSVPNGEIQVASNMTRGWARVNLDVSVAYDTNIDEATRIINRIGQELAEAADWRDRVIEAPAVVRVNDLGDSGVALKILGQVQPGEQWAVTGELRKRVLATFAQAGIEIPYPHRVMISRPAGSNQESQAQEAAAADDVDDAG
jgi:moderate conductance mechanosensitive channel